MSTNCEICDRGIRIADHDEGSPLETKRSIETAYDITLSVRETKRHMYEHVRFRLVGGDE